MVTLPSLYVAVVYRWLGWPMFVLKALALLLESKSTSDLAKALLRRSKEFYTTLLNGRFSEPLFEVLLRGSFDEQWSWYVIDKKSCVNMPEWVGSTGIDDEEEFMNMVVRARQGFSPTGVTNGKSNLPK
ncbi:hypothetical protein B0T09DRAFT_32762 [Sordaria sp. MPI-SDFR-AT-0083]|nr:hypothetical protein B0T09DRAFT_32762 [Sordaria sp. MPI-SDFR-AT-0083]